MKALYLIDATGLSAGEAFDIVTSDVHPNLKLTDFAGQLLTGATKNLEKIDSLIKQYSENWALERMASVDRNVLRIGAYELLYMKETPVKVIIDEAIEVAKKYSKEDSNKFINGILDKIKNIRENPDA